MSHSYYYYYYFFLVSILAFGGLQEPRYQPVVDGEDHSFKAASRTEPSPLAEEPAATERSLISPRPRYNYVAFNVL